MAVEFMSLVQLQSRLDDYLEVEFTFRDTDVPAGILAALEPRAQQFILNWVQRIASTHIELGYRFACQAQRALTSMDEPMIEAWALQAMDCYDRTGLRPALAVFDNLEQFVSQGRERASGAVFDEKVGVLLPFIHGLSGRALRLERGEQAYTDSEVIYLPAVIAQLPSAQDNFQLYKAMVAHCWAQTRYGTFQIPLSEALRAFSDPDKALQLFHALEILRLDACIQRDLPGLYRQMQDLREQLGLKGVPSGWQAWATRLQHPSAKASDSLALVAEALTQSVPESVCYQGRIDPTAVHQTMVARQEREKAFFRVALRDLSDDREKGRLAVTADEGFELRPVEDPSEPEQMRYELLLDDKPVAPPEHIKQLMTSIILDLGNIPAEYLVPAGPGEYDLSKYRDQKLDPEGVWQGTYHEEGAHLYKEWDCLRQHYRKNWCVLREQEVQPAEQFFFAQTLARHRGLLKSLRRTFEALRGEDKLLKKQRFGDDVDIDALVEAWADSHQGLEMSDRLFQRMRREDRNIAVALMVDMSGSTKGWINNAEREALILLSESLAILGDRFAIYGFSGTTRKRCELFRIKTFEDPYDDLVKGRITGIQPQDYTRMGVAIRHLVLLLREVDARTKLLITLSDGKPEDYDGYYRGEYGIEDTRQALLEARQDGVHPFCITIDRQASSYLPHMYGAANYVVISDIARLPLKVSDIYRKLTS